MVYLAELLFGDVHGIWRRIEFVHVVAIFGDGDRERLVLFLRMARSVPVPVGIIGVVLYRWNIRYIGDVRQGATPEASHAGASDG